MFSNVVGWILVIVLMAAGFTGCFIPMVPGTPLILLGAFVYEWLLATPGHALGWQNLLGLSAVVVVAQLVDMFAALLGASHFGASRYGIWGAFGGLFIGLFFSLPGLILGPIAGVFFGELCAGKDSRAAMRAAWGTLVGNAAGILSRVIAGAVMIVWVFLALRA